MRKAQRADNRLGLLCCEEHRKLSSSPTASTGRSPLPEAHGSPGVSLPQCWAPAGRFHGKTFVKITKTFSAEQMPLQPVLLEMNEEQEESHSFPGYGAAPSAKPQWQPQGSSQDGGFPVRISLPLRPPRLLLVAAAGGGVRRRCDSAAF